MENQKNMDNQNKTARRNFDKSIDEIALQFREVEGLFMKHKQLLKENEKVNKDFPDIDFDNVRMSRKIHLIKYFSIILETLLAFRGFEFLFIRVVEIDIDRIYVFLIAFAFSFLIIEGSYHLLYFLKKLNNRDKASAIDIISIIIPLSIVPVSNIFAYMYDMTEQKGIFLALASITFLINLVVVNLLSKLVYNEKFSPKYVNAFKNLKNIESNEKQIKVTFQRKYKMIKSFSTDFFKNYQILKNGSELNIPLSKDYLWIIQNDIFGNKNHDFQANVEKKDTTDFVDWWLSLSNGN